MSLKIFALLLGCVLASVFIIAETAPSDVCGLPRASGRCFAYFQRWGYDSDAKKCVQFTFGGCLGNRNNFRTEEECINACA